MRPQPRETNLALNKHRIMNEVFRAGSRSRLELAKHLNINPTTAGDYVEELIGMGLLLEGEPATSGRGRSPIPLQLNADFGCFLGLDFEALRARAVLCDFSGEELHRREIEFKPDMGREDILKRIVFLAQNLANKSNTPLLSVVVAAPGLVDSSTGRILKYEILPDFDEVPLSERFESAFDGVPVFVEHNIRCHAHAELLRGSGRNCRNFLCLAIRSGVGLGIVIDGKPYGGASTMAGEVGYSYSPEFTGDPESSRRNLNDLVSATGVVREVRGALASRRKTEARRVLLEKGDALSLADIVAAAENGDEFIQERLEKLGTHLGVVTANLANIFSPEKIILAGEVPSCTPLVRDRMERSFRKHALPHILRTAYLENSFLGDFAGSFGAAWMGLGRLLPEDKETVLQQLNGETEPSGQLLKAG